MTETWGDLQREGYEAKYRLCAALPMQVWVLDIEVECEREISAAELTVLQLLGAEVTDVAALSMAIGMAKDDRLVSRTLVKLLRGGAVETRGEGFATTDVGEQWRQERYASARERSTAELRLDPVHNRFEWVDHERPVFATNDTWSIELARLDDAAVLSRKPEIGELVAREGLPNDEGKASHTRRGPVDLRALSILSTRMHWREVEVDVMRHSRRLDRLIGYMGGAENPPLSALLNNHKLDEQRKWLKP